MERKMRICLFQGLRASCHEMSESWERAARRLSRPMELRKTCESLFSSHFGQTMNAENKAEWDAMRAEMDAADDLRERVIKEMRVTQKNSKNAIYALQRGDMKGAEDKISVARQMIDDFLPIIAANPDLRRGKCRTLRNAV